MKKTLINRIYSSAVSRVVTKLYDILYREFPPVVRIETTNACNAACVMCPHKSMTRATGIMDQELYEKIVKECAANNVKVLHLHNFGEPLADKRFPERVALARKLGIKKVRFFTNGSLLSDEVIGALLDSGVDGIKLSIDGVSEETYESIRVGLKYNKVRNNLIRLVDARNSRGLKRPVVKLNFVLRDENRHEKGEFVKQWSTIVDKICFDDEHNWSGHGQEPPEDELLHACLRIWNSFTVLWDGRVSLCCLDYDGQEILGDINKQAIKEIWQGPRLRNIRNMHSRRDFSLAELCRNCSKIR